MGIDITGIAHDDLLRPHSGGRAVCAMNVLPSGVGALPLRPMPYPSYRTDMTPEQFRTNGHALVDWIADYLERVGSLPVTSGLNPGDVRAQLPEHPPEDPEPFSRVLDDLDRIVVPGLTHWQHPSFFAYFPANNSYASILGELASAGLGVQGMSWVTSPACTELESVMLDWMAELLDLPPTFRFSSGRGGGVIQGSASEATLCAILAARWLATNGTVNHRGSDVMGGLVAYATSQAHASVEKGLRIAGIGSEFIRIVPHDHHYAMVPEALDEMMTNDRNTGLIPFFVNLTSGTTSSLAFDPIPRAAHVARLHEVWVHVDAAMAGIAALVPDHRWVNNGLELVDSYATNPHKWMGINFDCDLFWTAHRNALLGALSILPEYLRSRALEEQHAIDYRDWQIGLGRRFRALKLWFALRCDGVGPAQSMIQRHVALTQELADWVHADGRFRILAPHPLNLLCIAHRDGNEATDALIERVNATREAYFTRTVLDQTSAMRWSIGSRLTERRHVERAWSLVQELAD